MIFKQVSFSYDFTVDGGDIGIKSKPVFLPFKCCITNMWLTTYTTLTSGGGAELNISVGSQSLVSGPQPIANYPEANNVEDMVYQAQEGGGFYAPLGAQVFLTISTATITAGYFQAVIFYIEL